MAISRSELNLRVRALLIAFTNRAAAVPFSVFTIEAQHAKLRAPLRSPKEFVIHS